MASGRQMDKCRPYRNGFSGRDVCGDGHIGKGKHAATWSMVYRDESGAEMDTTLIQLVERLSDMWEDDAWKKVEVKEARMPAFVEMGSLCPSLGKPDYRENDDVERFGDVEDYEPDELLEYCSKPPRFDIMTLEQLKEWRDEGMPLPEGTHAGDPERLHKHRNIKHPDDPLGLVVDKVGMAIAFRRRDEKNRLLGCVFVHVYCLGHASVMRQFDNLTKIVGCGAFHAAVEVYGEEWSYGFNPEDETGVFNGPPKYCAAHDYSETIYMGDTTLTMSQVDQWLRLMCERDYRQEDPLDTKFLALVEASGAPGQDATPFKYLGNEEAPLTEKHKFKKRVDDDNVALPGEDLVGWWGDEYDLLTNNCCYFSDHFLKVLTGKELPGWIYSLAKLGDGLQKGVFLMAEGMEAGHHALHALESVVHLDVAEKKMDELANSCLERACACCIQRGDGDGDGDGDEDGYRDGDLFHPMFYVWWLLTKAAPIGVPVWGIIAAAYSTCSSMSKLANFIRVTSWMLLACHFWLFLFPLLGILCCASCDPLYGDEEEKDEDEDGDEGDEESGGAGERQALEEEEEEEDGHVGPQLASKRFLQGNPEYGAKGVLQECYHLGKNGLPITCPLSLLGVVLTALQLVGIVYSVLALLQLSRVDEATCDDGFYGQAKVLGWLLLLECLWSVLVVSCSRKIAWICHGGHLTAPDAEDTMI